MTEDYQWVTKKKPPANILVSDVGSEMLYGTALSTALVVITQRA